MSDQPLATASDIVAFWRAAGPQAWFEKNDAFDTSIRARFLTTYEAAAEGRLSVWEGDATGALALLLLLDQFPRNMFRGSSRMFETDPMARAIAAGALIRGFDAETPPELRAFFYLPFEHSENPKDQERALAFFSAAGNAEQLKWAEIHADIIRRFGRFPHRNAVLGRDSTAAERAYLDNGGFAG